jgi:hypothetical protein
MSLRKSFVKAAAVVLMVASGQHGAARALTPQQVLHDIETKGAPVVIEQQYDDGRSGKTFDQLLEKIETGTTAWLDVARTLYPATDAATTSGLEVSLSIALTHNPERVLQWTGQPDWPTLEHVCTVRFIEADEETVSAHARKVRAALKRVTSPALASKKAECSKLIEADDRKN